jgi:CRP-like cAMP-binding protein
MDGTSHPLRSLTELAGPSEVFELEVDEPLPRVLPDATRLLVIEEGVVAVGGERLQGRRIVKRFAGRGAVLLPPGPDEWVAALRPARLRVLSDAAVERIAGDPAGALFLLGAFESSLENAHDALGTFAHVHHVDRVRDLLLRLAREHGRVDGRTGVRIDLPLTHELLAEAIASARETTSRAMEALTRAGFVVRERGGYRLLVAPDELFAV